MENLKSQSNDEFVVNLFENVFADISLLRPELTKTLKRDMVTFRQRVLHEGLSFATKTLPKLGKALDRALEIGQFEVPKEFKRSHGNQSIPAFMQGMFNCLFDRSGCLAHYDIDVVRCLRQVCFLAYKLQLPYSVVSETAVVAAFEDTERELDVLSIDEKSEVLANARRIVDIVLHGFNPRKSVPKHGPGAVSTGERGDEKWHFKRLFNSIHQRFPYYDFYVVGGGRELCDRINWYKGLQRSQSGSAKVVLVPKDSRGPRLISCEPLEYQYIQQMIGRSLVSHLESNNWTKGQVNFTDQSINQNIALSSSKTREFATLDMKDASDRVSCRLIELLFPKELVLDFMAARSESTRLPNGSLLRLKKFAPMGSALCFPVEAVCFWALAVATLIECSGLPFGIAFRYYRGRVFVYGDDLIVPSKFSGEVMRSLPSFGLMLNEGKCFSRGHFRESCGVDALMGEDVTPYRLKSRWTGRPSDGNAYVSYISLANRFEKRGWTNTASFIWNALERVYGKIPYCGPNAAYPGREVRSAWRALSQNIEAGIHMRHNASNCGVEIKARFLKKKSVDSDLDSWQRLLRNLTQGVPLTSRVALSHSAQLSRGWRRVI